MTPDEVEKKYRQSDGSINIPGDVKIIWPKQSSAAAAIAKAKAKKANSGSQASV